MSVPVILGVVTASGAWLIGAHFTNTNALDPAIITVTDTAGNILCQLELPPGAEQPYEWPFRPATGVKWISTFANVKGHIWGYI